VPDLKGAPKTTVVSDLENGRDYLLTPHEIVARSALYGNEQRRNLGNYFDLRAVKYRAIPRYMNVSKRHRPFAHSSAGRISSVPRIHRRDSGISKSNW